MPEELLAPMVGKIIKVHVKTGSVVQEDEEIMVMESIMELETGIDSPCDGVVKEIRVSEGARVEEDEVLAIIE